MQAIVPMSASIARIPCSCRPPHGIASFHSTPITLAKWKSKWDCKAERRGAKPSKTYMRYVVRQKRAEMKKTLKDYLLYGKISNLHFQDEKLHARADQTRRSFKVESNNYGFGDTSTSGNSSKAKFYCSSHEGKQSNCRSKSWHTKESIFDEECYEDPGTVYESIFGRFGGFNWSYDSWGNSRSNKSEKQHKWKDEYRREKTQSRWNVYGSDDEDESTTVGSHAHRVALGLPPTGPLKLDDVKSAFRTSALKWHPDKHQGPSQAVASEKFKLCVNAYNCLCSDLKIP